MADGGKYDCPTRRFSDKDALQLIFRNESCDLYSSDRSTEGYYFYESISDSSSEDELPTATQRNRSKHPLTSKRRVSTHITPYTINTSFIYF